MREYCIENDMPRQQEIAAEATARLEQKLYLAHRAGWEQCKREVETVLVHRHNCLFKADGSTKGTLNVIDNCIDVIAAMEYKEPTNGQ